MRVRLTVPQILEDAVEVEAPNHGISPRSYVNQAIANFISLPVTAHPAFNEIDPIRMSGVDQDAINPSHLLRVMDPSSPTYDPTIRDERSLLHNTKFSALTDPQFPPNKFWFVTIKKPVTLKTHCRYHRISYARYVRVAIIEYLRMSDIFKRRNARYAALLQERGVFKLSHEPPRKEREQRLAKFMSS